VPDETEGAGRWSLDHLFLDRNAVPVLVEVKRASDTRARREVVAQMLDYAANGVAFWPVSEIMASYQETCRMIGAEPETQLAEFLEGGDPESFWKAVESNLKAGRVRMVFLADEISKELRRIVEFLNEQMRPAEVLAVEVVQYVNPTGKRTLVPSLVGATERAKSAKSVSEPKTAIDRTQWLASLSEMLGEEARRGAEKAISWMEDRGIGVEITKSQDSICATMPKPDGKTAYPFFLRKSTGNMEISLANLRYAPAFASEEARLALLSRIREQVPSAKISSSKSTAWPSVSMASLLDDRVWQPFRGILEDVQKELQGS